MNNFNRLISSSLIVLFVVLTAAVSNAAESISPPDALKEIEAGNMILLDIRSPEEWKQTGVASVAIPLTMHSKEFLNRFQKVVSENKDKKIGIICATGGRSQWLQGELAKRGLTPVIDVSEGMMGNKKGPGWIARGLAMKKIK